MCEIEKSERKAMGTPIIYLYKDFFTATTQVIVNPVNCEGVMGKGLAFIFKKRYPDMFKAYQKECKNGKLRIGRPTLFRESTPWIINFPTKKKWSEPSKLEYIEAGLKYIQTYYKKEWNIQSIGFPKLGTGEGKLSWDEVGPLMAEYLSQMDIPTVIYISECDIQYQLAQ